MKAYTLLLVTILLIFVAQQGKAQNLIAVTNETSSLFYTKLDLAITNATDGDIIYLPGGIFSISVPINKRLQIIGVGHHPDSCSATGITQITGDISIVKGSSGGSLIGCKTSGNVYFITGVDETINNYSIERCNIYGVIQLTAQTNNIFINECVLYTISGISKTVISEGLLVTKCIMERGPSNLGSNCYFFNNIFRYSSLNNISSCYFRNNIFNNLVDYCYNCYCGGNVFENNLFNKGQAIFSGNTFYKSITGPVTILFKNKTKESFDYDQDYHILENSPAHHSGTDGTDLGIYGTASPWKDGSMPSNPHIQTKIINSSGGNLNVKIRVAAQEN